MAAPASPRGNVMTSAELEAYQKRRAQEDAERRSSSSDDEEDQINYDSDSDSEAPKYANQRKRQEAHLAGYRQQMMKTTEGPTSPLPPPYARTPSLRGPWMGIPDDDDDDDVPLAVLQAQRRSFGRDAMSRLSGVRSNPNLRATAQEHMMRPGSSQGNHGTHLALPSFARGLPQDPFADSQEAAWNPNVDKHQFTGGLVGMIASEERAKAARRGSPSGNFQPSHSPVSNPFALTSGPYQLGQMNQMGSISQTNLGMSHMGSMSQTNLGMGQMNSPYGMGMPAMPHSQPSSRPQTPTLGFQMQPQQMQFLQPQSQFLQSMPGAGQHRSSHSWGGFPPQQTMMNNGMVNGGSTFVTPKYGSYTPSIAPSERSTVGLPSRYRPVTRTNN
ncbi:hypothetical protein FALBO_7317 [Fusarium albosuccineum]|uniref:Uncharacterized protein n=1 Tax=Fusarium albosuccineum TaxID=1237068 RepID=A0A8H4LBM4_9HYPO|nr:hypothetical protein FALBO_7317 [Fusarium albosuccineum]